MCNLLSKLREDISKVHVFVCVCVYKKGIKKGCENYFKKEIVVVNTYGAINCDTKTRGTSMFSASKHIRTHGKYLQKITSVRQCQMPKVPAMRVYSTAKILAYKYLHSYL